MIQELIWPEVPPVYLNPGSAWDTPMQMGKKYQKWQSRRTHCTKKDFARSTEFIFTSWGCPQIQVSLVHLFCVSVYKSEIITFTSLILYMPGLKLKVTLNCLHFMMFSRYWVYQNSYISLRIFSSFSLPWSQAEREKENSVSHLHKKSHSFLASNWCIFQLTCPRLF